MNEKIHELLANLRLKGMAAVIDREIQRAEKEGTSVSEVISRLLLEEQGYRRNRSLLYRVKGAKIPSDWTLKSFPFDRQPGVSKAQINELAGLGFIERGENIVFVGDPGDREIWPGDRAPARGAPVRLPGAVLQRPGSPG